MEADSTNPSPSMPAPRLEKARHIKYWMRCLKTLLPHQYTGNDSNRMYLAFLMISALDLLGALDDSCDVAEKANYIDWIYHCQHPRGGFRAWPGTDFGDRANANNAKWDPANTPATYFALTALLILGDDLKRVRRRELLLWLREMQRDDGSFGETLVAGRIEGGRDPRFGYCATGIRSILRGRAEGPMMVDREEVGDIDVDRLVRCIRASASYDGGIADEPYGEPHAGYTFCSLGALNFVGRLRSASEAWPDDDPRKAPSNPPSILHWLVYRQTELLDPEADPGSEFLVKAPAVSATPEEALYQDSDEAMLASTAFIPQEPVDFRAECVGMNGRPNKAADTCYAWWAGAPLHLLGQPGLYNRHAVKNYLLGKTQHPVLGGFGKFPGDLPDIYHSCLGLAALSLAGCEDVKAVDAGMCVSKEAKGRLAEVWKGWGVGEAA